MRGQTIKTLAASLGLAFAVQPAVAGADNPPAPTRHVRTWVLCEKFDTAFSGFPPLSDIEWRGDTQSPSNRGECPGSILTAQAYARAWYRDNLRRGVTRFDLGSAGAIYRVNTVYRMSRRTNDGSVPEDAITLSLEGYPFQVRFVAGGD